MLEVPETRTGTLREIPCYRCLFTKPVPDNWCAPETCDMLDAWLEDEDFIWEKHFLTWILRLEEKKRQELAPSEIF